MLAMADTPVFSCDRILFPSDFRAGELIADYAAAKFAVSLRIHGKAGNIGTAGNTVLVDGIILIFQT